MANTRDIKKKPKKLYKENLNHAYNINMRMLDANKIKSCTLIRIILPGVRIDCM